MTAVTRPRAVEGVVEYKPSPMQQKVIDLLSAPASLAVLAPLIPKDVDLQAVAVEVYRAVTVNPDILKCTDASIIMAIADCLRCGLIIGKEIHLVPVRTKVARNPDKFEERLQAWPDYKGDIALVIGSGAARHVEAHAVYENDVFEPHLGTDPHIKHLPAFRGPRGKMIGAYAVAFISQTLKKVCVMRLDEIEAIRQKSKQWNPDKVAECPEWYACKTPTHKVTKDLPKNPKLARVLAMFERSEAIDRGEEDVTDSLDPANRVEGTHSVSPSAAAPTNANESVVDDAEITAADRATDTGTDASVSYDRHGEAARGVTRPHEVADVPPCPKCGGPVWDNRAANDQRAKRGERLRPDFACKNRQRCDGLYWRGEWPPEDDTTQDLAF